MAVAETVPFECQGVDFNKALANLPERLGELFFSSGEQRLLELDQAMTRGDAQAVMDAAHSLASLTGLLHIQALPAYAQEIYAAAQRSDLDAARPAHERLRVVLGWALGRVRAPGK
ncbi:MAG: hypothetical protein AUJ49_05150 [Desulfovibrionaceae bacterium CG1_02_65_16]|nr:MAG: hypothetical protein AUJ49_05150 [Desulfovibrionaceae bacterium CG1_02_65_16]